MIGGSAGAVPPLVGWAAVTGDLGLSAWLLFAIVFYWTPPHFWALALMLERDYAAAGIPMLPVVRGVQETKRQILLWTLVMIAVSILPVASGAAGVTYLVSALALGADLPRARGPPGARPRHPLGPGDLPLLPPLPRADLRRPRRRRGVAMSRAARGPSFFLSPLGIVFTTVVIDLVGFGIVLPILPLWAETFGASPVQIGLITASYAVMQLLFAPVWGRLSDRYGRRPIILVSLAGSAVSALMIGLAGTLVRAVRRPGAPGDRRRVLRGGAGVRRRRDHQGGARPGDGDDRRGVRAGVHPRPRVRRDLLRGGRAPAVLRGGRPRRR